MMKIDSQQLAPRMQPRAALISDSFVFFRSCNSFGPKTRRRTYTRDCVLFGGGSDTALPIWLRTPCWRDCPRYRKCSFMWSLKRSSPPKV
jgi:hypothetical protein